MRIRFDSSSLRQTKWNQYAVRFIFGGLITAAAGVVAKQHGPVIGGLLLAFPAIFPASATLIEKHEKQRKEQNGMNGIVRGRQAASMDAAGSAMGSVGLLLFAAIVWCLLSDHSASVVLFGATAAWLVVSVLIWEVRKHAKVLMRRS